MQKLFSVDAVIFDLDGVLVDSNEVAERHWALWAERRGVPFESLIRAHHGRPTVQTMREFAPHLDVVSEARAKEDAEADDTDGLVAFPGAHRILSVLPADRWAIATSGTRRTAMKRLQHTVLPIPARFITADDVQNGKPDPEPYLKAIQLLGVRAEDCLVFEDAPAGIQAAKAAGAQVIGITSTNTAEALARADLVVDSLDTISIELVDDRIEISIREFYVNHSTDGCSPLQA